jgi:membrane-associated phospholipid phosphatase
MKSTVNSRFYKLLRDLIHIALSIASILIYGGFGVVAGSLVTILLILVYSLNEYMRVRGFPTRLTKLYKPMLTEEESVRMAKSPLFLALSVLILMNVLPFEEASTIVLITGLGDGFSGLLRALRGERSKSLWRIKTSLAGFTIAALVGGILYEPYSVLAACVFSTVVEALMLRIDDNLTVPFTAALMIYVSKYVGFNSTLKGLVEGLDFSIYSATREWWMSSPMSILTPLFMVLDMVLPLLYITLALFTLLRRRKLANLILFIMFVSATLTLIRIVKVFYGRYRPPASIKQDFSFPSIHMALAGVFTGFFYNSSKCLSILIYVLSALTVLEILALGNHWFSDVVAGFLIGLFITLPFNGFSLKSP